MIIMSTAGRGNLDPRALLFRARLRREELWGTLEQASFSLVFARNKEHAHDWLIQMKSLLNALLCESAAYYNMRERKSLLLLEILVINSNGIKRSRNTEEIV